MTDRFKGFLITLEKEIREDDAEYILNALKMIKGVLTVKPYVATMEDYMMEERAKIDLVMKIQKFMRDQIK